MSSTLFTILILFVAIEHLLFMYVEMFGWLTIGKKIFKTIPKDLFEPTKTMAANQGLYNGFLAAGLIWSRFIDNAIFANQVAVFFLVCVAIAGIYGAATVSKTIFYVQAVPALLAIAVYFIL